LEWILRNWWRAWEGAGVEVKELVLVDLAETVGTNLQALFTIFRKVFVCGMGKVDSILLG